MRPLVSILIPAFNAEAWIAECLRSAVAQTWPNKEIIVVDDGSRDGTLAAARRFESQGVKVFTQKNQGAAAARNLAFTLSRGDYIQWLDADDLLDPDKIAAQVAVLESGHGRRTLASGPWGRFLYRHQRADFIPTSLWCDLSPVEWLTRKMGQNLHMQTGTWLVSRELTKAAGPWNTQLLTDDDGEYFCRVLLQSDGVRFVPQARTLYRAAGPASLSYIGRSGPKIESQFSSMQMHIGYLRSLEDSDSVRRACVRYLQTWVTEFYPERHDIVERAQQLAIELGGRVEIPRFSWKYAWLGAIGGPVLAKRAQVLARRARWSVMRSWDRMLCDIERWGSVGADPASATR